MAFDWLKIFPQLSMSKEERVAYRLQKWNNFFTFWDELFNGPSEEEEAKKDRYGDGYQIIGIKNLSQRHRTDSGDNVLTQTTEFRTAGDWDDLKADAARLEFTNSTGSAVVIKECTLIGKLILRNSGMFIHDKFRNWEDIEKNGENGAEYSSNDIVTNAHTSNIATYLWQRNQASKHYYSVEMKGSCYWLHPGIWARFTVGGAGQSEYIDSVVRLEGFTTQRRPGSLGTTSLLFVEVKESWKYNSTSKARTLANAVPWRNLQGSNVLRVASSVGTEVAQIYCEASADNVGIQAAIDAASDNGGGVVHLGQGTFIVTAAIEMKSNVTLEGEGPNASIIEKNCDDHGIKGTGGSGTELTNIGIRNLTVTRNAADTNFGKNLLNFDYCDDMKIENVHAMDSYYAGIVIANSDRLIMSSITVDSYSYSAIEIKTGIICHVNDVTVTGSSSVPPYGILCSQTKADFSNITIRDMDIGAGLGSDAYVFLINTTGAHVSNLTIDNIDYENDNPAIIYGLRLDGDSHVITNVWVNDIVNSTVAANCIGVFIDDDDCVLSNIYVTGCSGSGIIVDSSADDTQITSTRSTGNGTNFTDAGTNTTAIVEES